MRDFAQSFYQSQAWKNCRQSYKQYAGGLCENCKKQGIITAGVIVHHKQHLTPENINDPTITLNYSNLMLLCRDCHAKEHAKTVKRYCLDQQTGAVKIKPDNS